MIGNEAGAQRHHGEAITCQLENPDLGICHSKKKEVTCGLTPWVIPKNAKE